MSSQGQGSWSLAAPPHTCMSAAASDTRLSLSSTQTSPSNSVPLALPLPSQAKRLSECSNVSTFQIPPDTGSGLGSSSASFHSRLQSELQDVCSRLATEYTRCVTTLECENARLSAEIAQMSVENARLRESMCGGDPDSAAGCPLPRPRSQTTLSTVPAVRVQQLHTTFALMESSPSAHPLAPAPPSQPVKDIQPASPSTLPPALDLGHTSAAWWSETRDPVPTAAPSEPAPEVSSLIASGAAAGGRSSPPVEEQRVLGPALTTEISPLTSDISSAAAADAQSGKGNGAQDSVRNVQSDSSTNSGGHELGPVVEKRPSSPTTPRQGKKRPSTPAKGAVHEGRNNIRSKSLPARVTMNPLIIQNNDTVHAIIVDEEEQSEAGREPQSPHSPRGGEGNMMEYTMQQSPQILVTEPAAPDWVQMQTRPVTAGGSADAGSGLHLEERSSMCFESTSSAPMPISSQLRSPAGSGNLTGRLSCGRVLPHRMRMPTEHLQVAEQGRSRSGSMASCENPSPAWKGSRRQSRLNSNSRRNSEMLLAAPEHRRDSVHSRVSFMQQSAPDISEVYIDDDDDSDNGSVTGSRHRDGCESSKMFWKTLSAASAHSEGSDGMNTAESNAYELLAIWKPASCRSIRRLHSKKSELFTLNPSVSGIDLGPQKESDSFVRRIMIHPSSLKHITWDFLGLLFIGYDCVVVPLEVFNPPDNDVMTIMLWMLRIFWTLNILVCFLTGVLMPEGTVEMAPKIVAKRYICTWFFFDVFLVAFDWIEVSTHDKSPERSMNISRILRGMRMFRTVRVIRLMQTPEFVRFVTENIRSEEIILSAVIGKIMIVMFLVAHFLACAWYGVARLQEAHSTKSWLEAFDVERLTFEQKYAWAFHWSLSQFSGEALIPPSNSVERSFTVTVLFFCFMFSTYIVSSITTSITRIQLISNQQSAQTAALRRYLSDHRISRGLATRVENNAQFAMAEQKRNAPESSIDLLRLISEPLLVELHFEIHFVGLASHPFFYYYHDVNPAGVRKLCNTAVSRISFSRGDVLFSDNEVMSNPRMFFLLSGQLLYAQDGKENRKVYPGEWLCEPALWTSWTHVGTLHCLSECRLCVVDAKKFQDVIGNCQTPEPALYGSSFVKWLNRLDKKEISDVGENDHALHRMMLRAFPIMPIEEDEDDKDESSSEDENGDKMRRGQACERTYSQTSTRSQNGQVANWWWMKYLPSGGASSRGSMQGREHRFSSSTRRRGSNEMKHKNDWRSSTMSFATRGNQKLLSKVIWFLMWITPSSTKASAQEKPLAAIAPTEEIDSPRR